MASLRLSSGKLRYTSDRPGPSPTVTHSVQSAEAAVQGVAGDCWAAAAVGSEAANARREISRRVIVESS